MPHLYEGLISDLCHTRWTYLSWEPDIFIIGIKYVYNRKNVGIIQIVISKHINRGSVPCKEGCFWFRDTVNLLGVFNCGIAWDLKPSARQTTLAATTKSLMKSSIDYVPHSDHLALEARQPNVILEIYFISPFSYWNISKSVMTTYLWTRVGDIIES